MQCFIDLGNMSSVIPLTESESGKFALKQSQLNLNLFKNKTNKIILDPRIIYPEIWMIWVQEQD